MLATPFPRTISSKATMGRKEEIKEEEEKERERGGKIQEGKSSQEFSLLLPPPAHIPAAERSSVTSEKVKLSR